MKPLQEPVAITFRDRGGLAVASMLIAPRHAARIARLDHQTATERGEAPIQLIEGQSYEFMLTDALPSGWRIRETLVVQPSALDSSVGRIEPSLHTGILPIELEQPDGSTGASVDLEVRSAKIDYYSQYRTMLSDIADQAVGLVTDIRAPAYTRLEAHPDGDPTTLHQKLALIRSVIDSDEFRDALERIAAHPDRRWTHIEESIDARRGIRPSRAGVRAIARAGQRITIPAEHPAASAFAARGILNPSLPAHVPGHRSVDTFDTPANQFIVFALRDMQHFLSTITARLDERRTEDRRLRASVGALMQRIERELARPVFASVGNAGSLSLGNPVIQRKAGYREILRGWIRFRMAARLNWTGGLDMFHAGKRDIAQLYEYWLFFLLLDVFRSLVQSTTQSLSNLITYTDDGFDLRLAAGAAFTTTGHVAMATLPLVARFSYNRVFSGKPPNGQPSYPRAGSWTRSMRPDFTFSFWPASLPEAVAETSDCLIHIHFDAKYRVESIAGLFGIDSLDELEDNESVRPGNATAKRSDLLKMHAYRDAIRRSQGAYVLYPGGDGDSTQWREYHELLPGLGAFAVRPGDADRSIGAIERFISDAVECLCTSLASNARPATGGSIASSGPPG